MSAELACALLLFAAAAAFALVISAWRTAMAESAAESTLQKGEEPAVSVVVPARDEERNIVPLLQDLYAQRYPKELLEVIVVDDGSQDRTIEFARGMQRAWPQLKVLPNAGVGKKAAITTGVDSARGGLVILTDADARCGPERIASIAAHWKAKSSSLVIAPVWTEGSGSLGALQELEQAALLGAALGSASTGWPFLAYGANLAFSRDAFRAVHGYTGDQFSSGDDVFLLKRMREAGHRISAIVDPAAMVTVQAEGAWSGFLRQRLRWAGKMRGSGAATLLGGLAVLLLPWAMLWATCRFNFVQSMGGHALYVALLLVAAWLCWLLPILGLVRDSHRILGRRGNGAAALLTLTAFSAYAPVIAVLSLALRPKWKGRRV